MQKMRSEKYQDINVVQAELALRVDELEDKVKEKFNSTEVLNSDATQRTLSDCHYNEILHHLHQIKHHLEKIDYHRRKLEHIEICNNTNEQILNGDPGLSERDDNIEKRAEEEIKRSKSLRVSRSASLKYVLQWEKMLDEQREEIKRQNKSELNSLDNDFDITQTMVRNRVQKFEGFQKPKRVSSTVETFLDFSCEKPRRIKSYPILEDLEGELESETTSQSGGDSADKWRSESDLYSERASSTSESITSSGDTPSVKALSKGIEDEESAIEVPKKLDNKSIRDAADYKTVTKPRIVEMHYKQPLKMHENT